jgi:hypothetical protein
LVCIKKNNDKSKRHKRAIIGGLGAAHRFLEFGFERLDFGVETRGLLPHRQDRGLRVVEETLACADSFPAPGLPGARVLAQLAGIEHVKLVAGHHGRPHSGSSVIAVGRCGLLLLMIMAVVACGEVGGGGGWDLLA